MFCCENAANFFSIKNHHNVLLCDTQRHKKRHVNITKKLKNYKKSEYDSFRFFVILWIDFLISLEKDWREYI